MYTLYLKTHNETGLKYLGYTTRKDVHKYKGSGYYWKRHILKHGYDVTTEVLGQYNTQVELNQWGLHYTKLFDVVNNKDFANLKEEAGVSGKYSIESRKRMSDSALNRIKTYGVPSMAWTSEKAAELNKITWQNPETRKKRIENMSKSLSGLKRAPRSDEFKSYMANTLTGRSYGKNIKHTLLEKTCPHCNKTGSGPNMTRYHFDKCKMIKLGEDNY
jgi:hypothetical protein